MNDFVFKFLVRAENLARIAKETVIAILEDARAKLENVSEVVVNLIETFLILPFFWIESIFRFLRQYFEFEKNFQKNFKAFKEWYAQNEEKH